MVKRAAKKRAVKRKAGRKTKTLANELALKSTKELIVITGPRGSGKSTALARYPRPSELDKMVVVDTEGSMSDILRRNEKAGLSFGRYIQAYDRFGMNDDVLKLIADEKLPWARGEQKSQYQNKKIRKALIDYWIWFKETLNDVLDNGYEYLAIDTIEPIEAAMTAWAEANPKLSGWTGKVAHGGLEIEAVRPLYDMLLDGIRRRGIHTILLATHISPQWINNRLVPGKVKMSGRLKTLSLFSTFMGWMIPHVGNPNDAPACAVLKCRWGEESVNKESDEWEDQRVVLPERIPVFNWKMVKEYQDGRRVFDPTNPEPGEVLSQAEREMIEPTMLNDAQMKLMIIGAEDDREKRVREDNAGDLFFDDNGQSEKKLTPRERRLKKDKA